MADIKTGIFELLDVWNQDAQLPLAFYSIASRHETPHVEMCALEAVSF